MIYCSWEELKKRKDKVAKMVKTKKVKRNITRFSLMKQMRKQRINYMKKVNIQPKQNIMRYILALCTQSNHDFFS